MKRRGWLIHGVLGGLGWAWLGFGPAQAGVIPPTDPTTLMLNVGSTVTVSLYQLDSLLPPAVTLQSPSRCTTTDTSFYKDVTDCWLPEWDPVNLGKSVFVVVNGSADPPALVPPAASPAFALAPGTQNPFVAALTTSAYPGQCTNFGSGAEADFQTLGPPTALPTSATTSVVGYELKPNDCGGMAVIQVGSLKFIAPKDGTASVPANGLPEAWENLYGGNLNPSADIDTGPAANSPCCDGIAAFDEYRGFIVSGKQIRTDPTQKDVFVHIMNPVCSPGTSLFGGGVSTYPTLTLPGATLTLGAGATFTTSTNVFSSTHLRGQIVGIAGGRATIVAVSSPTSVSVEITQPFPPGTSTLAAGSWQLGEALTLNLYSLVSSERVHLLGYVPGATNSTTLEWVDNFVSLAVSPSLVLTTSNDVTDRTINANRLYGPAQKGLRIMECVDPSSSSTLGWSIGVGSPNQVGNAIVFSQRIFNYITNTLIGVATTLKFSTASLVNGSWTWSSPTVVGNPNVILSKAMQFYTAHEIVHSLDLTPTIQGTNRTSYGYHWAPGTGDCIDQAITTTSKNGVVTFNIPSICGGADNSLFLIK